MNTYGIMLILVSAGCNRIIHAKSGEVAFFQGSEVVATLAPNGSMVVNAALPAGTIMPMLTTLGMFNVDVTMGVISYGSRTPSDS